MCYMNKHSYHYSQWNCLKSQWSNIKYILSGTKTLIFGGMSRGPMKQKVKCLDTMNAVIFREKWGRLACLRTQMAGASCCVGVLLQMGLVHFTKGQEMCKKIKHHLKTSAKKLNLSQKWHWFQVDNDPKHIAKLFTKLNQYQRKNIVMKAWISSHKNPKIVILLTTSDQFFNRLMRWQQIANNKTKTVLNQSGFGHFSKIPEKEHSDESLDQQPQKSQDSNPVDNQWSILQSNNKMETNCKQ